VTRTFVWTARLSVGAGAIDEQHRELFSRVNALLGAIAARRATSELLAMLGFLGEYVVTHFADEARLMADASYPRRAEHLAEHARFDQAFGILRAGFARGGATSTLAADVEREVYDWLTRHVMETDRELGEWLASRGLAAGAPGKTSGSI